MVVFKLPVYNFHVPPKEVRLNHFCPSVWTGVSDVMLNLKLFKR